VSGALQTVGVPGTNPSVLSVTAVTLPEPEPMLPTTPDVPALAFDLQAGALEGLTLQLLRIKASGPARDDLEVPRLKLWEDVDQSGTVTPGDRIIAVLDRPFPQDDGEAALPLAETIPAGGTLHLLVTLDLYGRSDGGYVQLSVDPAATPSPVVATGTLSGLFSPLSGTAVQGPTLRFAPLTGSSGHSNSCVAQISTGYTSSGPGILMLLLAVSIVAGLPTRRRPFKRN
jgi:hypothetical protein